MKLSERRTDPNLIRQIVTLVAIIVSIVTNTITNIFPLKGLNIGELSNTLFADVHFTPANYAFAIWGIVYIGLIGLGIYQFQLPLKHNPRLQNSGYLLAIACLSQCIWIFLFLNRQFYLSVIAMFGILIPLIMIHQRLRIGTEEVSRQERWFVRIPISLYMGWIAVATVLNVANALYISDWNGWGIDPIAWTAIMMVVSAAIGALVLWRTQDPIVPIVIVWALIAIAVRQFTVPLLVTVAAILASGLLLVDFARSRSIALGKSR